MKTAKKIGSSRVPLSVAMLGLFAPLQSRSAQEHSSVSAAFQTSYYLQDPLKNSALTQNAYSSMNLSIEAEREWYRNALKVQSTGAVGLNCKSCTFFEVSEAYFAYSADENNSLSIGRKKHSWSYLDSFWHLGTWQPRFIQDELRPIESGLTGFHFELKPQKKMAFTALLSPISIPERGTQLSFRNDRLIRGDSPWFIEPPKKVSIVGKDTEIDYRLAEVNEGEILFSPTIALQGAFGDQQSSFWTTLSYAFKSKNQIGAYYQPYLKLDSLKAEVDIYPENQLTHNFGLEAGGKKGRFEYWISLQAIKYLRPTESKKKPGGFSDAMIGDLYLSGVYLSTQVGGSSWAKRSRISLGMIQQYNDTQLMNKEQGNAFGSLSKSGYSSAIKGVLGVPVSSFWNLSSTYTYGMQNSDAVFSLEASYVQSENLTVSFLVDFLSDQSKPEASIWGRFRGNDRVIGSFAYVF